MCFIFFSCCPAAVFLCLIRVFIIVVGIDFVSEITVGRIIVLGIQVSGRNAVLRTVDCQNLLIGQAEIDREAVARSLICLIEAPGGNRVCEISPNHIGRSKCCSFAEKAFFFIFFPVFRTDQCRTLRHLIAFFCMVIVKACFFSEYCVDIQHVQFRNIAVRQFLCLHRIRENIRGCTQCTVFGVFGIHSIRIDSIIVIRVRIDRSTAVVGVHIALSRGVIKIILASIDINLFILSAVFICSYFFCAVFICNYIFRTALTCSYFFRVVLICNYIFRTAFICSYFFCAVFICNYIFRTALICSYFFRIVLICNYIFRTVFICSYFFRVALICNHIFGTVPFCFYILRIRCGTVAGISF